MKKLVVNCETGESQEVDLTPEEIQQKLDFSNIEVIDKQTVQEQIDLIKLAIDDLILNGGAL